MLDLKGPKLYCLEIQRKGANAGHLEILKELLHSLGIPKAKIVESCGRQTHLLSVYLRSFKKARSLRKKLRDLSLKGISVSVRSLSRSAWMDRWKKNLKPFFLTRRLKVIPYWLMELCTTNSTKFKKTKRNLDYNSVIGKAKVNKRQTPQCRNRFEALYLDPSPAFGSGLHETTRFMARLIEHCRGRFKTFLDIGTGTGLLSIAAFKCGAEKIRAIDLSREAVKAARENLRRNQYPPQGVSRANIRNFRIRRKFDFVAANLFTHDLIVFKRKILACVKRKGFLAVSGISCENFAKLKRAYTGLPLRCCKIEQGKKWAAVLFQRT